MNPLHDFNPIRNREDLQRSISNGVKSEIKLLLIVAAASAVLAIGSILLLQAGLNQVTPTPIVQTPPPPTPSPQPQAIEGWQTYRSEEIIAGPNRIPPFELQYPADTITTQPFHWIGAQIQPILQSSEEVSEEGHGDVKDFRLFLYARGDSSPQESLDRYPDSVWQKSGPIEKQVGGEKVQMVELRSVSTFCETRREYYFSELMLKFVYCNPNFEEIENQILSTFRFVED